MFATFETAQLGHCQTTPKFNGTAVEGLPREGFDKAQKEISAWDAYEATPLLSLSGLAERLKLGDIRYKHEASRFGLGSFKALAVPMPSCMFCSVSCPRLWAFRLRWRMCATENTPPL